ncbi:hypothetical protein RAZWK3B_00235 [Roseobacter sp. AzwK-3b]|nr:hypothetical protein RAZWK3B_00235 [Roseobacter sp. AzwK-3b]
MGASQFDEVSRLPMTIQFILGPKLKGPLD